MPPHRYLPTLLVPVLLLSACQTPPPPPPLRPISLRSTRTPEPVVPPGVYISPVQHGNVSVSFAQSQPFERTFPNNQIGANLAFTGNLRMPKLDAVEIGTGRYQLRMRFSNATETPLFVTLNCIYEGESRSERLIRAVEFPVNTFRDIALDLDGAPGRKLNIQATAVTASELGE